MQTKVKFYDITCVKMKDENFDFKIIVTKHLSFRLIEKASFRLWINKYRHLH